MKKKIEQIKLMIEKIKDKIHTTSWMLPLLFAAASFLIFLPALFLVRLPCMDVLTRYAPMADAFAAGDWNTAFHPRVPPFLPGLAGCISFIFRCSGFMAVKLASLLMFSLSFFALIPLFRRIFSFRTTIVAGVLAMFCSHYMRLIVMGLRESCKGFFFTLGAYALVRIYQEKDRRMGYILLGTACGGMIYVRDDSVLAAIIFVIGAIIIDIRRNRIFPWRTLLYTCCIALLTVLPLLASNYRMTGYPVPSNRFIPIMSNFVPQNMFGEPDFLKKMREDDKYWKEQQRIIQENNRQAAPAAGDDAAKEEEGPRTFDEVAIQHYRPEAENYLEPRHFLRVFYNFIRGSFIYLFFPTLFMICWRIYKKEWKKEETIVLLVPVIHALLIFLQVLIADGRAWVTDRYLLAMSPMLFGWAAMAFEWAYDYSKQWLKRDLLHKRLTIGIAVTLMCLLYVDAISAEIRSWTSSRQRARQILLFDWVELVQNDYKADRKQAYFYLDPDSYQAFRRPRIYSEDFTELGYLSGGETMARFYIWGDDRKSWERMYDVASVHHGSVDYMAEEVPAGWTGDTPEGFEILDYRPGPKGKCYVLLKRKDTE